MRREERVREKMRECVKGQTTLLGRGFHTVCMYVCMRCVGVVEQLQRVGSGFELVRVRRGE